MKFPVWGLDVDVEWSHPTGVRGLKCHGVLSAMAERDGRTPLGCVD